MAKATTGRRIAVKAEILLDESADLWRVSILDEFDDEVASGSFETVAEASEFAEVELG